MSNSKRLLEDIQSKATSLDCIFGPDQSDYNELFENPYKYLKSTGRRSVMAKLIIRYNIESIEYHPDYFILDDSKGLYIHGILVRFKS